MIEELFTEVAREHPRCVWLDGGGGREWSGRRSLLGWLEPSDVSLTYSATRGEVLRHAEGRSEVVGDDIWTVLEREVATGGQWFGYLGYACRADLPAAPSAELPDAVWMRPSRVRMVEHEGLDTPSLVPREGYSTSEGRWASASEGRWSRRASASEPVSRPPHAYRSAFAAVQEALHAGDTYEANLTYRLTADADRDPAETYLRLRRTNPAPYAGFLQHDVLGAGAWLLSSSPERYALVDADGGIETRPIKGTTPRADDPDEDAENARRLAEDPKFRSENLMIVDLLRNDLSMVCEPGTVTVPDLMRVESYASVHQLVSTVRGRLRTDVGTVRALRALFPAGSMTGAPKLRTMELVDRVETTPRGAYAGAFGWISADGPADLGVVIRTLTSPDGRHWTLGTGGGITVRSDVDEEYAESRWKAERLLAALGVDSDRDDGMAG
ncbi:anthranilate synthase component I family protein [Nocardioides sp. CER19]|uniref:anthranilate synthase component I family protein n=1 Tax=Nocardioides sp. CER19 TaxID=3038538 RepID=UPI00244C9541|nr:anthranilate synthase component I family protein [Nocardioides sp. CER19]MDH2412662.1 anthranilate synthase component I family protein [Nocardioides sp. CER19]